MAEIRRYPFIRHLRSEPNAHVLAYRNGGRVRSGRGLSFWFRPLSAGISEIPVDDRETGFLFHGRSIDYQDVTVQGVITWRVVTPDVLADRVDFSIDLSTGVWLRQPIEKVTGLLTQIAQQHGWAQLARTAVRDILAEGPEPLRAAIASGLQGDPAIDEMGIAITSVRVSGVAPTTDVERALETPTRERIQQEADRATFERRAMAVEKERAIQEAELQNQIELARREQQLIAERGQNELRRVTDEADSKRITSKAEAERSQIESSARADSVRLVEGARADAERQRIDIYRDLPPKVMLGLAARELAGKLQRIDHLNVSPDMFGPQLMSLIEAGTRKLEGAPDERKR